MRLVPISEENYLCSKSLSNNIHNVRIKKENVENDIKDQEAQKAATCDARCVEPMSEDISGSKTSDIVSMAIDEPGSLKVEQDNQNKMSEPPVSIFQKP